MSVAKDAAIERWGDILSQLPECLAGWERPEPPPPNTTARDWLQIYALFQHWYRTNDFPDDHQEYGLRLAPLICTNPKEQHEFHQFWQEFWKERQPSPSTEESRQEEEGRTQQAAATHVPRQRAWFHPSAKRLRNVWAGGIAALVLTLGFTGLWIVDPDWGRDRPSSPPASAPPLVSKDGPDPTLSKTQKKQAIPTLSSVPLREPPPSISLSEQEVAGLASQFWHNKLVVPVVLICGILGVVLWWRRIVIFDQIKSWQKDRGSEPIKVSHRHARQGLPTAQRARLAAMRFHQSGHRIHWGRTVERTARAGGFPHLQWSPRQRQAEYVMVCDSRHYRDQTAWLLRRVYEEWRATGIHIHYYDFDRHPELVWPGGNRDRQAIPLAQLRHRHPAGRLLLVAEQEVMFQRVIGGLQTWVEELKEWPAHSLALLNDPSVTKKEQLSQGGIQWQPLLSAGDTTAVLESLGGRIDPPDQALQQLPSHLQTDTYLWDPDPQQRQEVVTALSQVVGDDGMRLLRGMAMYPKLHGTLTFALHRELQDTDKAGDDRLWCVMRLPWCRAGWLPKWLRDALLNKLSPEDYQPLHKFYRSLFCADDTARKDGQFALGINRPPARDWKQWIKHAVKGARRGEVLHDAIFARVLLSSRWKPRLVLLARLFQRVVPRELIDRIPAVVKVGAVVPTGIAVAWLIWQGLAQITGVGAWLAQDRLEEKYQMNAQHIVTLRYHPKAKSLVEPMAKGLQAVGFQVAWERNDTIQDNVIEAPMEVGDEIARVAQYNSWGREYPVFKAEQAQISLALPLEAGQVFRDTPPPAFSRAGEYPKTVDWSKSRSVLQALLPRMVQIPAGTFTMGSPESEKGRDGDEGPQHEVRIPAFEIGESEVTFAEWDRCVEAGACPQVDDQGWGRSDRPVINVSWDQAQVYIQWLNQQADLHEDKGYRLPSEAEWEYAARGKTQTAYFWGDEWECGYGNGNNPGTKCPDGFEDKTAPVKQFKPNGFGLYDTSGNVWEWVQDCWVDNYQGAPTDGSAWEAQQGETCERRALRGGGWVDTPASLRSAIRSRTGFVQMERAATAGFVWPGHPKAFPFTLYSFSLFTRR